MLLMKNFSCFVGNFKGNGAVEGGVDTFALTMLSIDSSIFMFSISLMMAASGCSAFCFCCAYETEIKNYFGNPNIVACNKIGFLKNEKIEI